jgi:hypothetical protein
MRVMNKHTPGPSQEGKSYTRAVDLTLALSKGEGTAALLPISLVNFV